MSRFNPKFDANIIKQILASTGGDKQKLIEMFNDPDQAYLQPAILMADMQSQALKRDAEIKRGQGQGQHPTVAAALGLAPPPVLPAGLGAIGPQGGGMPAPPQGMQMASAAPQGPVRMAAGGMTELPDSYGLESLPIPDSMYNEESFAGGGIVAFAKGSPGEVEADARARAKRQAEAYLGKPISDAEFDMLLRATHAEASAKSNPEEQAMIMGSMLNRARAKGKTIENVLYARNQFESVTGRKGARVPSDRFVQGPSEKRANAIFDATSLLPRVPLKQTDFTASNRNAYLPGTNVGYLDKLAEKGTQIAGHMFGMNIMPSDVQMARAEPPRSPLDVFTRPLGTTSAQAAPPIPRMAQPQTPQAQMPQFDVASAEPSGRAGFDFPIQLTQARVPQAQMPQFDVAAETPSASLPGKAGFDFPIQLTQARVPQVQMPQFKVASAPTRADQMLSALNTINPIGTARAAEKPKAEVKPSVKEWEAPFKMPAEYLPMYTPDTLDPEGKMTTPERILGTAGIDYFHGLGNTFIGGARGLAGAGNRVADFFTRPVGMPRKGETLPASPSPASIPASGSNNYSRENDPMLKRMLAGNPPTAATPAVPGSPSSPGDSGDSSYADAIKKRYDLLSNLIGKSPELTKISDTELAAQRDQDYGMALLAAAAKGLSSKDPTLAGALGAAAEGAIPALTESAKDRKVREREQRLAQQQRDMLDYKTRADLASAADTSVRSGEMLAAQTPEAIQYAQRAAATHQAQNPNLRPGELNTVFNKALVEYRQRIAKPTGQLTPFQAQRAAQDAALYGKLPLGPDGKRMTVEQYTDDLLQKYGYGSGVGEWAVVG